MGTETRDAATPGAEEPGAEGTGAEAWEATPRERSDGRSRSKATLLGGIALASALALLGATQPWVTLHLAEGAAAVDRLTGTGQELNASLSPVALAGLASALALTIAGRGFRRVLGVLVALLGAGIAGVTIGFLASPAEASAGRVTELTGLAGTGHADLLTGVQPSAWPTVVLVCAALLVVLGVLVLVLGGRWRTGGRKYEAGGRSRGGSAAGGLAAKGATPDRISDWDALSGGDDPTSSDP